MSRKHSDELIQSVLRLKKDTDYSYTEIGDILGINRMQVAGILFRYRPRILKVRVPIELTKPKI